MSDLEKFRQRYPQYDDLSDDQVAENLQKTYYSDIPLETFRKRIGLDTVANDAAKPPSPVDRALDNRKRNPLDGDSLADFTTQAPARSVHDGESPEDERGFFSNAIRLAGERGSQLIGRAVRGAVGRPGEALEEKYGLGQIVFGTDWGEDDPADGKFRVRYMNPKEYKQLTEQRGEVENLVSDTVPNKLINVDFGGEARHGTEDIKAEFAEGDVLGTAGAVIKFGAEQGIQSLPDMVALMTGIPAMAGYLAARSDEMGETRAENKGLDEQTLTEQVEALPAVVGSALFDKFGLKYIKGAFGVDSAKDAGRLIIEQGVKAGAKEVAKKTGKAVAAEAATEAFQEGVIEYLGEKLGTDAPMSWEEATERGFFGGLAGGVTGGGLAGPGALVTETIRQRQMGQTDEEVNEWLNSVDQSDLPTADQVNAMQEPPAEVPRETPQEPEKPLYSDERLNKGTFRVGLAEMAENLPLDPESYTAEGVASMPPWMQEHLAGSDKVGPHAVRRAVDKAVRGESLGVGEQRLISSMLDHLTDGEVAPSTVVEDQISEARENYERTRKAAATELDKPLPETSEQQTQPGELYQESEYLPEMQADTRITFELATQLTELGEGQRVNEILLEATTPQAATLALEKHYQEVTRHDQQKAARPGAPSSEAKPDQPAQGAAPNGDRRQREQTVVADRRGAERRNPEGRKAFEQLSPEEQYNLAYTSELTGLPNERAFKEDLASAPVVASIDADGLGGINDHLGHDAGDALLQSVAQALTNTGASAYHKSGDEFYILGDSEAEVTAAVNQAIQELEHMVVETDRGRVKGLNITAGVGTSKREADTVMEDNKKRRQAQGLRNPKGQLPPGGELFSDVSPMRTTPDGDIQTNEMAQQSGPGKKYKGLIGKNAPLPMDGVNQITMVDGRSYTIPDKPLRRKHIIRQLTRGLGHGIYEGRVKKKGVLGFYRSPTGQVHMKNANDMEVTAHELAHYLDYKFPWVRKLYSKYREEMLGVSYDKTDPVEGFAEFIRLYMTQETEAYERAPGFYDAWVKAMKHPERKKLAKTLQNAQVMMHAWYNQGALARLDSKQGDDMSITQRVQVITDKMDDDFLQSVFDDLRPLKQVERDLNGGQQMDATSSGYKSLRLARGINGVVQAIVERGTVNWSEGGDIEFSGKGLRQVFEPVADKMKEMQLYMIARRAQELKAQGRENLIRDDEMIAGLNLAKKHPEFEEVFSEWMQFNDRMFDFYQDSGIISAESRAAIQEANQNYVPFNRIVESMAQSKWDKIGKAMVRKGGGPFMRLKGGTQNINDVFESIVGNTQQLVHMSLVNRGKQNFYDMLERDKTNTAGKYASPIPKPNQVDRDQALKAVLEGMGLSMKWYRMAKEGMVQNDKEIEIFEMIEQMVEQMVEGMDPMVTFFKFGQDPKGDNVDYVMRDGKKEFWEINYDYPELMTAINSVGPRAHNLALGILGGFSNALRRGVTTTPNFQISNFARDTTNAFTMSKGGMVPILEPIKALGERLVNDEHYWDYMINGGGFSAMAEADGINRDRIMVPGSAAYKNLWSALRAAGNKYDRALSAVEYATRISEYKQLVAKGYSKREAALAGREISTDFAMRGSNELLRYITTSVPFMNARLQGLYRNGREMFQKQPGKRLPSRSERIGSYALRSVMAITLPSLWLYMWNKDDERYQEMDDWVRDLYSVVFYGPEEDDYALIPKAFETGMMWGTVPERAVEYMYKRDEKELADAMLWMAMSTFALDPTPQIYKPWQELKNNKNFTGAPIIPEYLENVEPMEQYKHYTSDAMIALGRKMNISPAKAEHLVRGYFGTLGAWGLSLADMAVGDVNSYGERPTQDWKDNIFNPVNSLVNDGPLRRTKSESMFYDTLKETRKVVNTQRSMTRRTPGRLEDYVTNPASQVYLSLNEPLERMAKALTEIRKAMERVREDPGLTDNQKQQQLQSLQRDKNELVKQARANLEANAIEQLIQDAEANQNAQ